MKNPFCPAGSAYSSWSVFVEWPDQLKPPNFQTSLYTPSNESNYNHFLLDGELVGCSRIQDTWYPVYRVGVWVTPDKWIYVFTDIGRDCILLLLGLLAITAWGVKSAIPRKGASAKIG
ncbi:MAG: hypothetical protein ACLFVJ_08255 [Persicimonas sp.]